MPELQIELANHKHLNELAQLIRSTFQSVQSKYTAIGQPGYIKFISDFISKRSLGPKFIVVALIEDQFAGFIDFTLRANAPIFLTRIAVKPEFRGLGITRKLMQAVQESYSDTAFWELDVFHSNNNAKAIYESLGFETVTTNQWLGRYLSHVTPTVSARHITSTSGDHNYLRYGFTRTTIRGQEIGITGSAVRCPDYDLLLDDHFLSEVQRLYPKTDRAFVVCEAFNHSVTANRQIFEIDRSYRMSGAL